MTRSIAQLAGQADALRAHHRPGRPLVLPNAWDAASARAVVAAGFPVVATTSAGVAASLGMRDADMSAEDAFAAVGRIGRAVEVPVTADMEDGYGLAADELVARLLEAGAVGCNLEDTDHRPDPPSPLVPVEVHAGLVAAVKEAGRRAGVDVVVNARVDVHARRVGEPEGRTAEAVARARAYRAAGADCVYPILLDDADAVRAIVAAVDGAVNLMIHPGGPSIAEAAALGVARLSWGSGVYREAQAALADQLATIRGAEDAALGGGPVTA
jgi:2-methylisocitrate lyase-like PEP mutase family enzyme